MKNIFLGLLIFTLPLFSTPALGFSECDKYFGGHGDKRPDLWERIRAQKSTEADKITIDFLRDQIKQGIGMPMKLPKDYGVTPGAGGALYFPNSIATKQILDVLSHFKHKVLIGPNAETGYLVDAEHVLDEGLEYVDFKIRDSREKGKSKRIQLVLDYGYSFELAENLLPEITKGISGSPSEVYRFLQEVAKPRVVKVIDQLNMSGQAKLRADSELQIQTFLMLGRLGLNVQLEQGNLRKMGRLIALEEIPDETPYPTWVPTPNLNAKRFLLRLLKSDSKKHSDCESQFEFYSRPRYFSAYQTDEQYRHQMLQAKCTDQLIIETDRPMSLEIW